MKAVFMGTSDFAEHCLTRVLESSAVDVQAVYIKREIIHGRSRKCFPVKKLAEKYGLSVFQPASFKPEEEVVRLKEMAPDIIIVVDYGLILPADVLAVPNLGCWNIHASLLPLYRGAAPIQRAILKGDDMTGVTIMDMVTELDAGDILRQEKVILSREDDFFSLSHKLARSGAELLVQMLHAVSKGEKMDRVSQDKSCITFAPKIRKEEGLIDWKERAEDIHRRIRALIKWPVCKTGMTLSGKERGVRILKASVFSPQGLSEAEPGTVLGLSSGDFLKCSRT